jgi:BirA family transcriptional regulator, biotin operon repressor / biotin---[acetyl-CoA-carboxylase] ligase
MIPADPGLSQAYRLVRYDTVGSTNDEAKRLARDGAEEGTLLWAAEQTAGRGRRGRAWASPRGNLYASLVLRPRCRIDQAPELGFVAALAVGGSLRSLSEKRLDGLSYKWPNDVLLRGHKVAGILLESELGKSEGIEFVVIGIGINLVSSPRDAAYPATSLLEEDLGTVSPGTALEGLLRHFRVWAKRWREDGFAPIRAAWRRHATALGEPIQVRLEPATLRGRFIDIDQQGALLLETAGEVRRIAAGEVFPVTRLTKPDAARDQRQ